MKGIAAKKQLAVGNFLMNLSISLLLVFFLTPITAFITNVLAVKNTVLSLVVFQTMVNIIGIILFYPFLNPLGKFLAARFTNQNEETQFIHKIKPVETELALQAMFNETKYFLQLIIGYCNHIFELKVGHQHNNEDFYKKTPEEKYELIKHLHGDILEFYVKMQSGHLQQDDDVKFQQLISSVRNGMYAAKSLKDAWNDIKTLKNSSNDKKFSYYGESRTRTSHLLDEISQALAAKEATQQTADALIQLYNEMISGYTDELSHLYKQGTIDHLNETEISTIINYNRELYTAYKSLIIAAKDLLLNEKEAAAFDELPGFIR